MNFSAPSQGLVVPLAYAINVALRDSATVAVCGKRRVIRANKVKLYEPEVVQHVLKAARQALKRM